MLLLGLYLYLYYCVYILTVCVCMCMHAALMRVLFLCTWMQCHPEVRRAHLIPWSWRYRRFWDASQRWEPTSGPLEERYRSLTAVTAPQLRCFFSVSMKGKNSPGTTAQSFSWPTQTHVSRPALFSCLEVALPRPEAKAENWVGTTPRAAAAEPGKSRSEIHGKMSMSQASSPCFPSQSWLIKIQHLSSSVLFHFHSFDSQEKSVSMFLNMFQLLFLCENKKTN